MEDCWDGDPSLDKHVTWRSYICIEGGDNGLQGPECDAPNGLEDLLYPLVFFTVSLHRKTCQGGFGGIHMKVEDEPHQSRQRTPTFVADRGRNMLKSKGIQVPEQPPSREERAWIQTPGLSESNRENPPHDGHDDRRLQMAG